MAFDFVKVVLPDRTRLTRIFGGPFRGAVVVMNPRNSLRKVLGIYEHELNPWLKCVLPHVTRILDIGANDGYFTFGCAAAFRRMRKAGEIIAFEPEQDHIETLKQTIHVQPRGAVQITLVQTLVGSKVCPGMTTLDAVRWKTGDDPNSRTHTLIKIDVEGAELEILKGAGSWLLPTNYFIIEVHEQSFLDGIPRLFAARGLRLARVDQQPLPLLGGERRAEQNWWLVSDVNESPHVELNGLNK
jgi:hypothetical protein